MQNAEQIRLLKILMQHLDAGTNVDAGVMYRNPVEVYTCPTIAGREREVFFHQHPQLIGLSGDLPELGSFITTADFGQPILAVRDEEGGFRAFLNVCRHRGTVLESASRGEKSHFACPFHAWTYSNRGDLVAIPHPEHFLQ